MLSNASRSVSTILGWLFFAHIVIITASNYLVQIPISFAGFHTTWGMFTFPLIFLVTDVTVRLLGTNKARIVILKVMIPALLISYIVSVLFFKGEYQGIEHLSQFNSFVFRIAFASFIAYVAGQLIDILIFNRLRQQSVWWAAPAGSTIIGSLIDTFIFFAVAFYGSNDAFMANNWVGIAWVDYLFKLLVSLIFFVPAYGIVINRLLTGKQPAKP